MCASIIGLDEALKASHPRRMTNGVDGAIDELQSVRELLQTIVDKNPNFVRARVGVTRCDERLGILRTARLHGQKQSIMNAVHGTNYLNASLCDAGIDESMVTAVFQALDTDHSGDLNRDEVNQVAFDSFWAWWQQMSTSDKQRGFLERLSKGLGLV
jgi:hypothetical protein